MDARENKRRKARARRRLRTWNGVQALSLMEYNRSLTHKCSFVAAEQERAGLTPAGKARYLGGTWKCLN